MPKTSYNQIVDESGESKYIKFPEGDTKLRIVSDVYTALRHKVELNGKWRNIACPKTLNSDAPCPLCSSDKPRMQWVVKVLDRADNKIKILESGSMIFGQLRKLAENEEYGDPKEYDITINRTGEKLNTEYTVIPARQNTPLTEIEDAIVKDDKFDLDLYTTPRTADEIQQIIDGKEPETKEPEKQPVSEAGKKIKQAMNEPKINVEDIPF